MMKSFKQTIPTLLFSFTAISLAIWIKSAILIIVAVPAIYTWHSLNKNKRIALQLQSCSKITRRSLEWGMALLIALATWWVIESYIATLARIRPAAMDPNQSGESTWLVTKYEYGAARHIDQPERYYRTHRLRGMIRNDLVVFHNPDADTILVGQPMASFYQTRRMVEPTMRWQLKGIHQPVSQRPLRIMRLIGLPGETITINSGIVSIDGTPIRETEQVLDRYILNKDTPKVIEQKIRNEALRHSTRDGKDIVDIRTTKIRAEWEAFLTPDMLPQNYPDPQVYPFNATSLWNRWHLGPLFIPAKGNLIKLTPYNVILYRHIIEHFEGSTLAVAGSQVLIDGQVTEQYKFKMNYYWVMGDCRFNSFDSRYFGLLPENHIVGMASIQLTK